MIHLIKKALNNLTNYKFILSGIWSIVIIYLSLGKFSKPENIEELIPFSDKIVHFTIYFILSTLLLFEFRIAKSNYTTATIISYTILLGIVMELLQYKIFVYRTGDFKDIIFNITGTIMGYFFFKYMRLVTKQ